MTTDSLKKIITQANIGDNTGVIFCDADGNTIYSNNLEPGVSLRADNINRILTDTRGDFTSDVGGMTCLLSYGTADVTSWKIITVTRYADINKGMSMLFLFDLAVLAGVLLLTALVSFFFSRKLIRPVRVLQHGMSRVKGGDFGTQLESRSHDELGELINGFNAMASTIKSLYIEKYIEEIARKDAEFSYLQAQINPHFIYNTLQTMSSMALVYKVPALNSAAKALAKIIRYSVHSQKEVTVRDEINNLLSFLEIQKLRFGEFLNYQIDVDPGIYDCNVIKLLLQPIVENAITHGIEPKGENGKIIVSGIREGAMIRICIFDNGVGMEAEEMELLRAQINASPQPETGSPDGIHNNIGLRNINLRIKMLYGDSYGLIMESVKNEWTKISILIPAKEA